MDAREALARAMRLNRYGGMCPLWDNATAATKARWLDHAGIVIRHLEKAGFTIARADARKET